MNKEKQQDNTVDSVYETDCSSATQAQNDQTLVSNPKRLSFDDIDHGQNSKKAKKSLDAAWSGAATPMSESKDLPYIVETPVSISYHIDIDVLHAYTFASYSIWHTSTSPSIFSQSKALNSNSGVAFSPPSIVKDTLGDSGLLMDSDLTLCNSPEVDKSSQVYKIAKKFESRLLLSGGDYQYHQSHAYQQHQQPPQQQPQSTYPSQYPYQVQSSTSRLKSLSGPPYTANKPRANRLSENQNRPPNSRNIKIIKVDPTTFHKKVNKSGMMNQRNIFVAGNHTVTSTSSNPNEYYGFNPFADENDSSQSFQLSKSQNYSQSQATGPIRLFGADVTNVINSNIQAGTAADKTKINYPLDSFGDQFNSFASQSMVNARNDGYHGQSGVDVYGKSVFRSDDAGMYLQNPNTDNSCSNLYSDESQEPSHSQGNHEVIFKNYDLNDEYWLNFDQ